LQAKHPNNDATEKNTIKMQLDTTAVVLECSPLYQQKWWKMNANMINIKLQFFLTNSFKWPKVTMMNFFPSCSACKSVLNTFAKDTGSQGI
jgi:hypothetical protein